MPFTEGLLCNNGRAAILISIFANCTLTIPMQGGSYAAQAFRDCRGPDAGAFVWRHFRAGTRCCRGAHAGVASDATDIDKGLYTQQSFSGVLRSVQGVSFVNVTPEMKYFTKYESHGNYNQGFSYGDGYNALGYYQFDRRWSLIPFMKQAYNYNPEKYSMLKDAIDRGSEISNTSNVMYENGQLTELGHIAQDAFQGAYNTDPVEFSALQDAYAYNSYYAVTEAWLKSGLGIDISAAPIASRAWCGALPTCAHRWLQGLFPLGESFQ